MANFKNFKKYVPSEGQEELLAMGVGFLISDEGVDWYESQKSFAKDTLKIGYDPETKVIKTVSYDVSSLFPYNMSVGEVEKVPKRFSLDGPFIDFVFNEDKSVIATRVYSLDESKAKVDYKKSSLISEVMQLINPLQFAVDLEMATEEENKQLKALQKYVVLLNRVSQQETYPTGVVWPEIPTT